MTAPARVRFLADENIPMPSVHDLREDGVEVESVLEDAPGITDPDVIERARAAGAVLITFDSDIGEHVFFRHVLPPAGVIYLRFVDRYPTEAAEVIQRIFSTPSLELEGQFTTYRNGTVRQRPLPPPDDVT